MKDFKQNLKWFLLSLMFVAGTGYTWGATTTDTYTFTSKSWAASPSNWTSGKDGNQLTSGQGVQVTTGVSGANATSPTSYTNVTKIVVTYCTNATKGAGSIAVQVGSNAAVSQSVTTNGGTTLRTLEYTLGSAQSGNVKLTVTCTTNSIYINSIAITYDSGNTPDAPSLTPSCTFWPKTTETPSMTVTIAPTTTGSTVRYTTNGSDPTTTNGNIVISSTDITITETTTVKAIAYVGTSTSGISFSTYTLGETVNSIAAFKTLAEGTEARLYLSPENNARVLHVSGSEIYVRDNTGAICIYLASSLQNPVPQHDWHVAGWIIGKNEPFNGLPELKATSNTTTNYMAFAAPVTEEATEPVTISPNDFDNYKADWVKICDLRAESNNDVTDDAGNTFKFYNKYSLNSDSYYQDLYDYALVDLAGLAVPYGTDKEIVPIYYNDVRPIVYVIDEPAHPVDLAALAAGLGLSGRVDDPVCDDGHSELSCLYLLRLARADPPRDDGLCAAACGKLYLAAAVLRAGDLPCRVHLADRALCARPRMRAALRLYRRARRQTDGALPRMAVFRGLSQPRRILVELTEI